MHKCVILDSISVNPGDLSWENIESIAELTVYPFTRKDQLLERAKDADILVTNGTLIMREFFEQNNSVKCVCILATGYNIVDIEAASEKGIPVCNVPSYSTHAVAQQTIALLLEVCNRVGMHNALVQQGKWIGAWDYLNWEYPMIELYDKTLGIIGLGRIGITVAKAAAALGMKVIAYSPNINNEYQRIVQYVDLDTLYEKSDVISLHSPLFESTKKMINEQAISKMKDGVIIINTARGGLIDEDALANALESGKVRAAALDVLAIEPPKQDNKLVGVKNCLITPHIAWAAVETRARLINETYLNIKAFIEGNPRNVVNPF